MTCRGLDPNELIIVAAREISKHEPEGLDQRDLHKVIIERYGKCSELYATREWSPIIQRAIQILLDAELGYIDEKGFLHVNELAYGLISA